MSVVSDRETFSGVITVASRIVDTLSSGLYESPAACLKELVNNSYDADASIVNIFVKPDANRIIIEDDGLGMDRADFEKHFKRISESYKREDTDHTPSGRPMIGKIGIGFIAANEICDVMEIFSTKKESNKLLHVTIDFKKMRLDPALRRRHADDFEKADYEGEVVETSEVDSHYTHVFLKGVRGQAQKILAGVTRPGSSNGTRSLYGLSGDSIADVLADQTLRSWSEFDQYSETLLHVALNVPVRYYQQWLRPSLKKQVADLEAEAASLAFGVTYDGSDLGKPVVLRHGGNTAFISRFTCNKGEITGRGYFYVQHGSIRPQNINGLLIRIRHAAVGGYDPDFMDFPSSEGALFRKWISAEIWAGDELEDALNIDRKTLRKTHPAYVALQRSVHEHVSKLVKQARSRLYQAGSEARRKEQARTLVSELERLAADKIAPVSEASAREVVAAWRNAAEDSELERKLLTKYTVVDFYRLVLGVAQDVLSSRDVGRFIRKLTQHLSE